MPTIARSIDIRVPAEEAFEFIAEIRNLSLFHEGISSLELLSEKDRGLGVNFSAVIDRQRKGPLPCEFVVIDFVDYISMAFRATKGCKAEEYWHFARMAGMHVKTRITVTLIYQLPVPVLGRLFNLVFVRRIWTQRMEQTLQTLKQVLEESG